MREMICKAFPPLRSKSVLQRYLKLFSAGIIAILVIAIAKQLFGLSTALYSDLVILVLALLVMIGTPLVFLGPALHRNKDAENTAESQPRTGLDL